MTDKETSRQELVDFLRTIQRPDYSHAVIDEESGLVESGLIDSLALLQIVTYLEQAYGVDFSERGIDPEDLRSVNSILDLIAREAAS
jgi:acyl carrier protein